MSVIFCEFETRNYKWVTTAAIYQVFLLSPVCNPLFSHFIPMNSFKVSKVSISPCILHAPAAAIMVILFVASQGIQIFLHSW